MARFLLTLTTDAGEVLDTFTLEGEDDETADGDYTYPLDRSQGAALVGDINDELRKRDPEAYR